MLNEKGEAIRCNTAAQYQVGLFTCVDMFEATSPEANGLEISIGLATMVSTFGFERLAIKQGDEL
ncbi:hypothetical protein MED121_12175 [Marinomonas sp. MED121]|uniref:hypothetical protein n=1 Tax=Marinomonas sp. MED121 TaxID=314277 RepID=UPI000069002C|nr:hypothetical protein [Marinomonas sp. MED121]EAQ66681.1 hypothetical protein MED121_12175 [Marinomonas sp. MED121]